MLSEDGKKKWLFRIFSLLTINSTLGEKHVEAFKLQGLGRRLECEII